jgi:hypothetical protein
VLERAKGCEVVFEQMPSEAVPFVRTYQLYRFNEIILFFFHNKSASAIFSTSRTGLAKELVKTNESIQ